MELFLTQSLKATTPEIGEALWRLGEARTRTRERVNKIGEVDWTAGPGLSSVGDLLYHIAAIELDWLAVEVCGDVFPPGWNAWFPVDVRSSDGRLTQMRGEALERHLERLAWVRAELVKTFEVMTPEDYHRPRELSAYTVTPAWVLHHLTLHEAHHAGQIAFLGHLHRAAPGPA
ncbi:DinB family protein [Deinococcus hopiensis]|nr:DinB family protein [Deinococcus hopiensis]